MAEKPLSGDDPQDSTCREFLVDPCVNSFLQNIERHCAGREHGVVEFANVESVAELLLRLIAQQLGILSWPIL